MICLVPRYGAEPLWLKDDHDEDELPTEAYFEVTIAQDVIRFNSVCGGARLAGVFCYDWEPGAPVPVGEKTTPILVVATNDERDALLGRLVETAFVALYGGPIDVRCVVLEEPGNYWRWDSRLPTYSDDLCKEALKRGNFFNFATERLNNYNEWNADAWV